eukprot:11462566-Alexandrium_andersonii.AAC.1
MSARPPLPLWRCRRWSCTSATTRAPASSSTAARGRNARVDDAMADQLLREERDADDMQSEGNVQDAEGAGCC